MALAKDILFFLQPKVDGWMDGWTSSLPDIVEMFADNHHSPSRQSPVESLPLLAGLSLFASYPFALGRVEREEGCVYPLSKQHMEWFVAGAAAVRPPPLHVGSSMQGIENGRRAQRMAGRGPVQKAPHGSSFLLAARVSPRRRWLEEGLTQADPNSNAYTHTHPRPIRMSMSRTRIGDNDNDSDDED